MYRILPSCARFLYVKRARETLSLKNSGLGDLQLNNLSNAYAHMEVDFVQYCFTPTKKMKNHYSKRTRNVFLSSPHST